MKLTNCTKASKGGKLENILNEEVLHEVSIRPLKN